MRLGNLSPDARTGHYFHLHGYPCLHCWQLRYFRLPNLGLVLMLMMLMMLLLLTLMSMVPVLPLERAVVVVLALGLAMLRVQKQTSSTFWRGQKWGN